MTAARPAALIADDEPLLRDALVQLLANTWTELQVVAQARNGREAMQLFDALRPDVCLLDVQMPDATGVDAARHIGDRARLVFVTAYVEYAVQAFTHGVLDYLVKPVEPARRSDSPVLISTRARNASSRTWISPAHDGCDASRDIRTTTGEARMTGILRLRAWAPHR
jgi:CheY-like chemotaxis protein